MINTSGLAAFGPKQKLKPFSFKRRKPGPNDVLIQVLYCGICHSDIHQARNEWKSSNYPMVPGHEIAGRVIRAGSKVRRFKPGDLAGVGCFVDSCRKCRPCREGTQQFCENHVSWTYNGTEQNKKTPTFGGYSTEIVVNENYVYQIRSKLPLEKIAPLMCAGITTYSPLRHFGVKKDSKVGIVGLGGLGHMGVKLAASMGAEVTVLSTSKRKEKDARCFGAKKFVTVKQANAFKKISGYFDFILDTASANHDINKYLELLKKDGVMCLVGVPENPPELHASSLIMKRRKLAGSLIGGIKETQEMLDYCAREKIAADVEVIPLSKVNQAYERVLKGDVRYRFVIDLKK